MIVDASSPETAGRDEKVDSRGRGWMEAGRQCDGAALPLACGLG